MELRPKHGTAESYAIPLLSKADPTAYYSGALTGLTIDALKLVGGAWVWTELTNWGDFEEITSDVGLTPDVPQKRFLLSLTAEENQAKWSILISSNETVPDVVLINPTNPLADVSAAGVASIINGSIAGASAGSLGKAVSDTATAVTAISAAQAVGNEILEAVAKGKFRVDTPNPGFVTYYDADNDPLFVVELVADGRNRVA